MSLRIGVYAVCKDEAANVARWAASCADADARVVTDTGSADDTVARLQTAGVTVRHAAIVPWRWDEGHNAGLHGLPADVDVAIRLDLDEALAPNWRQVVEAAWTEGTTRLRSRYQWQPGHVIWCDRIHARRGFRWRMATHEWLHAWDGAPQVEKWTDAVLFIQERAEGKTHPTDLQLLTTAVQEAPADARTRWYFCRELAFAGKPADEQAAAWDQYLAMPGGDPHERAFAMRQLAELRPESARRYLFLAAVEAPAEPEAYLRLAADSQAKGDPVGALYWARFACQAQPGAANHASEAIAYGPVSAEVGVQAALQLGRLEEARQLCRVGIARRADHPELSEILADLDTPTDGPRC